MNKRFLVLSSRALPEPISLVIDPNLVTALAKKDEVGKLKAFDRNLLKYFKQNVDLMLVIKVFANTFGQTEDWVLEKFVKGLMFQDSVARKLLIRRDWTDENAAERIQNYFDRYRTDVETNAIPSAIVSCMFAAISGVLNLSDSMEVDNEVLALILPIMETPADEQFEAKEVEDANSQKDN